MRRSHRVSSRLPCVARTRNSVSHLRHSGWVDPDLTLGVLAHRGGPLVRRPELAVGMVQAVSRPSDLSIEVIARRPLDRRDARQRQRDIRSRRDEP